MLKYLVIILFATSVTAQTYIYDGISDVQQFGVYEITFKVSEPLGNPYKDVELKVKFKKPDRSIVVVDGFYDGANLFKARAYCSLTGNWQYSTQSNIEEMNNLNGSFNVIGSSKTSLLKGKLQISKKDPRQMVYDNGEWFLHIGDTGYRYVAVSEPFWKEYIDQSVEMGSTKIRVWFCESRHSVENLFTPDRHNLNLNYWQEIDKRLLYALNNYPNIIIQLIPYGEDSEEIRKYSKGDFMAKYIGQYSQARWSSFPNVYWCITNDRIIIKDDSLETKIDVKDNRCIRYDMIDAMGHDFKNREAWETLITNHQSRSKGYDFIDEPWSDIITLAELDEVGGTKILEYRKKGVQPVINDEDRYDLYRNPENRRYYFRRLMWSSLLSGGAATYGGGNTWLSYKEGTPDGVQGYYTLNQKGFLFQGGDDLNYIHNFFNESRLTLVNMQPDDSLVGNSPFEWKCIHDDKNYIIYLANPSGTEPQKDSPGYFKPKVSITLPDGNYTVKWFDPKAGTWAEGKNISGGLHELTVPKESRAAWNLKNAAWGDIVLLLSKNSN